MCSTFQLVTNDTNQKRKYHASQAKQILQHASMQVHLVDLALNPLHFMSKNSASCSSESFDAATIALIPNWHWLSGMRAPSVSGGASNSPKMADIDNICFAPGRKVFNVIQLRLGQIFVTHAAFDGSIPRVHVGIIFGCDVMRHTGNNHLGNLLRKVGLQGQIVVVICSDICANFSNPPFASIKSIMT